MDNATEKAVKVILSTKNGDQLKVAIRFARLADWSFSGTDRLSKSVLPIERALAVQRYRLDLLGKEVEK